MPDHQLAVTAVVIIALTSRRNPSRGASTRRPRRSRVAASTTTPSSWAILQNRTYPAARRSRRQHSCCRPKHHNAANGSHLPMHASPPRAPHLALGTPDGAASTMGAAHFLGRPIRPSRHWIRPPEPGKWPDRAMDEEEGKRRRKEAPSCRPEPARALAGTAAATPGSPAEPHARARARHRHPGKPRGLAGGLLRRWRGGRGGGKGPAAAGAVRRPSRLRGEGDAGPFFPSLRSIL
ncbi:hypothetical protein PVAP13_1KG352205 [Panicum virgatum]|uniref:Uncharacterized protein n=1 Tax=Panicum virgatum TaxID=38727 RepID=A0A8T0XQB6_PANVG|nr:hypothetical protein PVAP13_1KG352205 [Panicum virgatum]